MPPRAAAPRGSWCRVNVNPSAPEGTGADTASVNDTENAAVRSSCCGAQSAPACIVWLNAHPVVSTAVPGAAQRVARAEPSAVHREKSSAPPTAAHAPPAPLWSEKLLTMCDHVLPPVPAVKPSHALLVGGSVGSSPRRLTLELCRRSAPAGPAAASESVHGKHAAYVAVTVSHEGDGVTCCVTSAALFAPRLEDGEPCAAQRPG